MMESLLAPRDGPQASKGVLTVKTDEDMQRIVTRLFFFEYVALPFFYVSGYFHLYVLSNAGLGIYFCASAYVQYRLAASRFNEDGARPQVWRNYYVQNRLTKTDGPLESIMGVPMRWTGLKEWHYLFVTVAPNYIHVLSTATATGAAWATWTCQQTVFEEHWSVVPFIGPWIGAAGLPGLITFLLVVNFAVHSLFMIACEEGDICQMADAANLLFLGELTDTASNRGEDGSIVRVFASPFTKFPMLWTKVSLLSVSWSVMGAEAKRSLLWAVALSFYAVVPISWPMFRDAVEDPHPFTIGISVVFGTLLAIICSHFAGLWLCSSHDFAVFAGGCTPVSHHNMSNCTAEE